MLYSLLPGADRVSCSCYRSLFSASHSSNSNEANSIEAVLERLTSLYPKAIDLSLDRVYKLLRKLGHPESALPPVIHVAGTNGKGSVIAYLRAFLEAAGLSVHTYTSPHLVRFNERIRVAGQLIDDYTLLLLLEEVEQANAEQPITFFEITTCAAFLAFARTRADLVLLETGLGGRMDATNILRKPALTVLTPIAIDHVQYLGSCIESIAKEKVYILKPGVGCVSARQKHKVATIIELRSIEIEAPVWCEGREWHVCANNDDSIVFDGLHGILELPLPGLVGNFQIHNAGLAIAAIERLPFNVSTEHIISGLKSVEWPGRVQLLVNGPLVECLPTGWEVWIDGGHNPAAADALVQHIQNWLDRPLVLVIGMLNTKDAKGFIAPLSPYVAHIRTVRIPHQPASLSAEMLAVIAQSNGHHDVQPSESVTAAVSAIVSRYSNSKTYVRILITGSLYLVGSVLRENW